jgi:hypothetical protein
MGPSPLPPSRRADAAVAPSLRPLTPWTGQQLRAGLEQACADGDGPLGAHCIHELWMRGEIGLNVEAALERLWTHAADSIPDWLPMRYVDWLATAYAVSARLRATAAGRHNIYLVLLDYSDSRAEPYGVYVGMSHYSPERRFDQHKAGIRAAGSVLRRGLEVLTGPTQHLQHIARAEAGRIEEQLAEALRAAGLFVQGGH